MPRTKLSLTLLAALLLALPVTAQASAPPPETATFTYTANLEPIAAAARPGSGSAINSDIAFWGNTAYQGTYVGFHIVDISNPAAPTTITNYEDCRGNQGDVIIWNTLLVRSWNSPAAAGATCDGQPVPQGWEGLHLFDVSNPADPALVGQVQTPCGSHTATGVPDPANNRLIVYNNPSSGDCPGFTIVEVPLSNPGNASIIGTGAAGRACHDTAVILGDAMRAACAGGNGFSMFSLGGRRGGSITEPVLMYSHVYPQNAFVTIGHAATFSWDGEVVAFGHEPGGGTQPMCTAAADAIRAKTMYFHYTETGTQIGEFTLPRAQGANENCTIHNFNVVPTSDYNILVAGNYQSGISVVDFTNPARPVEFAYADPAPLPGTGTTGGDWSTHWYDGEIYESDITRGLIVWKLHDARVAGARTLGHLNPQTQEFTLPFTGSLGKCKGKDVTLRGYDASEVLRGTPEVDVIFGGKGKDRIFGRGGNDILCGGGGNDTLSGGVGHDLLLGQGGKDVGKGGQGQDTFKGGAGNDRGSFERGRA